LREDREPFGATPCEARERLAGPLAARRLVDFLGPQGWQHSATNLGRVEPVEGGEEGVSALRRRVLPLVEVRVDFTVSRAEMRDDDRGALDVDLESLDNAAHQIALAENSAVFNGWAKAGIQGMIEGSPFEPEPLGADANAYPRSVARAVEALRERLLEGAPHDVVAFVETVADEVLAGVAGTASAQPFRHDDHRGYSDHRGYGDHWSMRSDWRRGGHIARADWNRGRRVDYRSHRLSAPPRGYEWRQVDNNYVLAAVATGVIASIILANQ